MTFISFEYAIFLIVMVFAYYIIPKKYRYLVLLLGSCIFYYLSSGIYSIFLLLSILSIYILGLLINKQNIKTKLIDKEENIIENKIKKRKKLILFSGIIFNFAIIIVLKYSGFILNIFNDIFNTSFNAFKFVLPLGISYYTLMAVSYIVDVYRGKYDAEKNIFKVALYLTFFPQMVEGPISNYKDTANALYQGHNFNIDNILKGLFRIFVGIFKTLVISYRAGIFVDNLFDNNVTGPIIFLGAIIYTVQIYADFSGCIDIVCGTAYLFNIKLPENFRRPFFSRNVQEFWKRWHITLGLWIKNYIFYPFALSRLNMKITSLFNKHLPKWLSTFLVSSLPLLFAWLFCGIWHGASFKYILYGLYYYVLIIFGILLTPLLKKLRSIIKINEKNIAFKIYEIIRTGIFVCFGMMLFRSKTFTIFINMVLNIFNKNNRSIMDFGLGTSDFVVLIIYVILLLIVGIYNEKKGSIYDKISRSNILIQYTVWLILMLGILTLGLYGPEYDASDFIYGEF